MTCLADQLGMEFSQEEIAAARKTNTLLSMELELSRLCNLRCVYCYASSGQALENELTLSEIYDVVDQAQGLGVKKIIVLGGGEPLIYPHIFEVVKYIRNKELMVDVFTNGQNLTEATAVRLYDLGVGVVLKMNSRQAEVQDYLGGKKGTLTAINSGLAALQAAGYPDEKHTLGVETIICRANYDELPHIWRWARGEGISPYVEAMTMQGRATEHLDLEVSPRKVQTLFEELARIDRDEFLCSWTPHPPLVASQCARHEYSCTVTAVGEVNPCPGVSICVGNIREKTLADILAESREIKDLRNIRTTIKGECRACELLDNCYGCRGHAYQVTGDYLAEDPLCWLKPNGANGASVASVASKGESKSNGDKK